MSLTLSFPVRNLTLPSGLLFKAILFTALVLFFSPSAHASCKQSGDTVSTYNFNAANISGTANITFSGTFLCSEPHLVCGVICICTILTPCTYKDVAAVSPYICTKVIFDGQSSAVNTTRLNYRIQSITIGGLSKSNGVVSDTWYGPVATVSNNNYISYSITISVASNLSLLSANPAGSYQGTIRLLFDMQQAASGCENNSTSWDAANLVLTYNYVMPTYCQLNTTSNVDFGTINDIGSTSANHDANGAISTTCNPNTSYSIYLGDGNNRLATGMRRMSNGGNYIAYQLYKRQTSGSATVWEGASDLSQVGGSGGVTLVGTGSTQITTVYGTIPAGTPVPPPGLYSDRVIVTVTY